MTKRILDLFCGAGGAAMGYHRAGFDVVGIDIRPQPRYPFEFHQADAFEYLSEHWREFDMVHASPPCQMYSHTKEWAHEKPMLISQVRDALRATGLPYIIENVSGAARDMQACLMLCGLSFGLKVFRHRYFESNRLILGPSHLSHKGIHVGIDGMCSPVGSGDANWYNGHHVPADHRTLGAFQRAMDIDWMQKKEIVQAIPPAYTEWIGRQFCDR